MSIPGHGNVWFHNLWLNFSWGSLLFVALSSPASISIQNTERAINIYKIIIKMAKRPSPYWTVQTLCLGRLLLANDFGNVRFCFGLKLVLTAPVLGLPTQRVVYEDKCTECDQKVLCLYWSSRPFKLTRIPSHSCLRPLYSKYPNKICNNVLPKLLVTVPSVFSWGHFTELL